MKFSVSSYFGLRTVPFVLLACASSFAQTPPAPTPATSPTAIRMQQDGLTEEEIRNQVALSPSAIIEILKREPGLLLEVKRLLVRTAYDQGRLLEERDLTDESLFRLIHQDFRIRVLATKEIQNRHYINSQLTESENELAENLQQEKLKHKREKEVQTLDAPDQEPRYDTLQTGRRPTRRQRQKVWQESDSQDLPSGVMPRITPEQLPGVLTASESGTIGASSRPALSSAAGEAIPDEVDNAGNAAYAGAESERIPSRPRRKKSVDDEELTRKPSPYKDVPALYDLYSQVSKRSAKERFGQDVFENQGGRFDDLPLDLPVGDDYVVGPGDGLQIEIWGAVSRRLRRNVDREGRLALPEVGTISVSGRTLGEVQHQVEQVLRTNFQNVSADVSLGKLKSIRVYVVGDVNYPGAYDVSSLSTPLSAVLEAGGPTSRGSIRTLRHFRGKQLVQVVDVYDLLLHGVGGNLRRLEPGDTILVPPSERQVTVEGMVRRPAIYEITDEKNLADVLALAGGVLPSASLRQIEVERIIKNQKRTMLSFRVPDSDDPHAVDRALAEFQIQPADTVRISAIGPYSDQTVYLDGHVYRPGKYSYTAGMKVQDLLRDYSSLLPEPYPSHAEIIRLSAPDYRPTILAFNLQDALVGKESANLPLQPYDTVRVFGRYDFEDAPTVTVTGEVRAPGRHQTNGQLRVRDAIYLAGGLTTNASLESVQIYRQTPGAMLKVIDVNLRSALSGDDRQNLVLESQDRIVVHRNAAELDPPAVFVGGEVVNPGKYPLATGMTATQLVRLAGGLKRGAYPQAADLTNFVNGDSANGTLVTVDLARAAVDSAIDPVLKDGDTLTIRQVQGWKNLGASVTLRGEVAHPSTYGIREGERLSSVLKRAGGFTAQGYPQGIVLERVEVRDIEQANREELIRRLEEEQRTFQTSPGINIAQPGEQAVLRQAFLQQQSAILTRLKNAPTLGRVVVKIPSEISKWENSSSDLELRAGDTITIPKRPDHVVVSGQVYNPTAFAYRPGRNAGWYLRQAGGVNELGNKGAIFVVRADGSVIAGGGGGWWKEDAVDVVLSPGDTVVVPEKLLQIKGAGLKTLAETAQIISSIAIAASVALQ